MLDSHTGVRRKEGRRERKSGDGNGNGIARPFFIIPFITFSIKRFGVCWKIFPPLSSDDGQGEEPEKWLDGLDKRDLLTITVFYMKIEVRFLPLVKTQSSNLIILLSPTAPHATHFNQLNQHSSLLHHLKRFHSLQSTRDCIYERQGESLLPLETWLVLVLGQFREISLILMVLKKFVCFSQLYTPRRNNKHSLQLQFSVNNFFFPSQRKFFSFFIFPLFKHTFN